MTLFPLTDCALLLGIDPKTLRLWLTSANVSCTRHPGDARLKCLTQPQLQHLATLHGRFLPEPLPLTPPTAATPEPPRAWACAPSSSEKAPHADLQHQLTHLQTQVTTLQEHVTHLALSLLREREGGWEHRLSPPPLLSPAAPVPRAAPVDPAPSVPHARSRALPLIDSGADGSYVVICPTQGVLALVPDSPAWFDWLASLTAFTFQGAQGRFSTTRKMRQGQRVQSWSAYRSLHGRSCTLYLGLTSHLTLAHLEAMATKIHSRLTTF